MRDILHKMFPWLRYRREVEQSQQEVHAAIQHSVKTQEAVLQKVAQSEKEKIDKTIMAARQAVDAARRICDNAK